VLKSAPAIDPGLFARILRSPFGETVAEPALEPLRAEGLRMMGWTLARFINGLSLSRAKDVAKTSE
jgi:hypothetical protein